ncbi:MAG: TolC family protein [Saprospiraceae bacterium]
MIKYSTLQGFGISIFLLFFLPFSGISQGDSWSLEKCISQAEKQSLTIQESQIGVQQAEISLERDKLSRYPNLSASTGLNYNLGRFINPVTNEFITTNSLTNNIGLSSGLTIYNGGRLQNTIAKSELQREISKTNLEQARRDVALDVASAYLAILLAIEQENNAKITLTESEQQLERINKLIRVGSLPEADKYEAEAQVARNEQSLVTAENSVDQTYLTLKTLLQIPMSQDFKIEQPNIPIPPPESLILQPYSTIVQRAVANQPSIKAGEIQLKSSEIDIELAKAGKLPSVNLSANTGTNYANVTQALNGIGYLEQFNNNLSGSIGVFVSIPIYDRGSTKAAVEQAKLSQLTQQISNRRVRQALETQVQLAFANAKAAAKQMQAAQRTLDASQKAFDNTKKRYELGSSTLLEFNTSRNNLETAKFNTVIAKYDYIFKLKILDFYQGKNITLK